MEIVKKVATPILTYGDIFLNIEHTYSYLFPMSSLQKTQVNACKL
jgi:hypothetical protein